MVTPGHELKLPRPLVGMVRTWVRVETAHFSQYNNKMTTIEFIDIEQILTYSGEDDDDAPINHYVCECTLTWAICGEYVGDVEQDIGMDDDLENDCVECKKFIYQPDWVCPRCGERFWGLD